MGFDRSEKKLTGSVGLLSQEKVEEGQLEDVVVNLYLAALKRKIKKGKLGAKHELPASTQMRRHAKKRSEAYRGQGVIRVVGDFFNLCLAQLSHIHKGRVEVLELGTSYESRG